MILENKLQKNRQVLFIMYQYVVDLGDEIKKLQRVNSAAL